MTRSPPNLHTMVPKPRSKVTWYGHFYAVTKIASSRRHQTCTRCYTCFSWVLEEWLVVSRVWRMYVRVCMSAASQILDGWRLVSKLSKWRMIFFTIWEPEYSSCYKYLVHHEIWKGSPRARAICETGVGTNWRHLRDFSTNKPPYRFLALAISSELSHSRPQ